MILYEKIKFNLWTHVCKLGFTCTCKHEADKFIYHYGMEFVMVQLWNN
jgi:hypothetical protein